MKRICFVCLGNICRSPMAEFIMKDKVKTLGLDNEFYIVSRATSDQEEGNPLYYLAKDILDKNNIKYTNHVATKLEFSDYAKFDYFICMDESNVRNVLRIFNGDKDKKVRKLLSRDVLDPWVTRNFQDAYNDILKGVEKLMIEFGDVKYEK